MAEHSVEYESGYRDGLAKATKRITELEAGIVVAAREKAEREERLKQLADGWAASSKEMLEALPHGDPARLRPVERAICAEELRFTLEGC